MRIKVDLQLDKPLRRGGKIASVEGEKFWISLRYERLSTFCFQCGRLGHDEKHCKEPPNQQNPKQYNDWIRAQGNPKMGLENHDQLAVVTKMKAVQIGLKKIMSLQ